MKRLVLTLLSLAIATSCVHEAEVAAPSTDLSIAVRTATDSIMGISLRAIQRHVPIDQHGAVLYLFNLEVRNDTKEAVVLETERFELLSGACGKARYENASQTKVNGFVLWNDGRRELQSTFRLEPNARIVLDLEVVPFRIPPECGRYGFRAYLRFGEKVLKSEAPILLMR